MKDLDTIIAETLGISIGDVNDQLSRDTFTEWDSFNHLLLISEIEKQLDINFRVDEVISINTYGQLRKLVADKKNG